MLESSAAAGIRQTCRDSHAEFPLSSLQLAGKRSRNSYITLCVCWTITCTWPVFGSGKLDRKFLAVAGHRLEKKKGGENWFTVEIQPIFPMHHSSFSGYICHSSYRYSSRALSTLSLISYPSIFLSISALSIFLFLLLTKVDEEIPLLCNFTSLLNTRTLSLFLACPLHALAFSYQLDSWEVNLWALWKPKFVLFMQCSYGWLALPWREGGPNPPSFPTVEHRQASSTDPPTDRPTDRPAPSLPTVQTPDHMQLGWSDGADGMNGQGGRRGEGESPDKHALLDLMKSCRTSSKAWCVPGSQSQPFPWNWVEKHPLEGIFLEICTQMSEQLRK